jgi:hypothetical protein
VEARCRTFIRLFLVFSSLSSAAAAAFGFLFALVAALFLFLVLGVVARLRRCGRFSVAAFVRGFGV